MIGVEPGGGAHRAGHAPKGRRRAVTSANAPFAVLAQQRDARRAQHEQIGVAVVVVVAGDRGGRRRGERGDRRGMAP